MKRFILAVGVAACALSVAQAAVIGKTVPSPPLTAEALGALPADARAAWSAYLARSQAAHRADVEGLAAERSGGTPTSGPAEGKQGTAGASMPLNREPAWYGGAEARHVADVIVSFQTPAGGWGKNSDRSGLLRARGQPYSGTDSYIGTLDNDATVTELRFLARVVTQVGGEQARPYKESFARGVDYLLAAQYPNGGWPQIWPLQGGYHDAVTFNDGAMLAATRLLSAVAAGKGDYAFVAGEQRDRARAASARALDCILAAQVRVDGRLTGWSQQHDPLTLAPVGARNFEPASLSSAESAEILVYLMSFDKPTPAVRAAIEGGAAWLKSAAIHGKAWTAVDPTAGRRLVDKPGAGPLWSRYYDIKTGAPIFGDRDRSIHDDVNEIGIERRNGYAWFNTSSQKALTAYEAWLKR